MILMIRSSLAMCARLYAITDAVCGRECDCGGFFAELEVLHDRRWGRNCFERGDARRQSSDHFSCAVQSALC